MKYVKDQETIDNSSGNDEAGAGIPARLYTACLIHELNRPLSVIQAMGETLLANAEDATLVSDMMFRDGLKKILFQLENIRHILGLGRLFASETVILELCPVNVNDVVVSARELVQDDIHNVGVRLDCDLGQDLPLIKANPYFLEMALINLITNACDALQNTGDSGFRKQDLRILVRTRLTVDEGRQLITIGVFDNGSGIPIPVMSRLFTPFISMKPDGRGNGLGLFIVKTIVEKCYGRVFVNTRPGSGTDFLLTFPCHIA